MKERGEFVRFVAVGAFAALVNWLSRIVLSGFVSLGLAVALAYVMGMTTAYVLSRAFVFHSSSPFIAGEVARFAVVNMIALAQVWVVTMGLAVWLFPCIGMTWHAEELAHAIGVASPVVTSYLGHKHFSFASARTPHDG